jgi:hypothetical protein
MSATTTPKRLERVAKLKWVPLNQLNTSPVAQREFRQYRVDRLLANFDPEQMGVPTVNRRDDGTYFVLDGQHRIRAYEDWLGDGNWEDQSIQVQLYEGMTEEEEAETFLKLNDQLQVGAFDKFRIAVTAGRDMEVDIDRIVRLHHLRISRNRDAREDVGTIQAVAVLVRIYKRSGPEVLGRTLRIVWGAYGQDGVESIILDGIALLVARHPQIVDDDMAKKLQNRLGVTPLLTSAEENKERMRSSKANCVAAAAVDIFNKKTPARKNKLPSWWRVEEEQE